MKKYKIGYVQGTFDLFHRGHLNILKNAKSICDYLIVGVNSDALVKSYKNKDTIYSEEDRLEIIKNSRYVDDAYITHNRDKVEAYERNHYDVLIMGDDWKGTDFYNKVEKELSAYGIDVVYFPYTQNISTTEITNKIKGKA